MSEELKPCPFCGGRGYVHEYNYQAGYFFAACYNTDDDLNPKYPICPLSNCATRDYPSSEEAIKAWNTRVALSHLEERE